MNPVLERAKKNFSAPRYLDVVEWKDEKGLPTRVFWKGLNLDDQRRLRQLSVAASEDGIDSALRIIVDRAEDADGGKMFDFLDRSVLRTSVDAAVISRLIEAMTSAMTVAQAEKN
jgi:hypothetical protein